MLSDVNVLFVYSAERGILHDKGCSLVKDIKDDDLKVCSEFIEGMSRCPHCYRDAIIRYGVRHNKGQYFDCKWFFNNKIRSTTGKDLNRLIVENDASIRKVSENVLEVVVREDTWQIRVPVNGLELWHNNYFILEDGSRAIERGFHKQKVVNDHTSLKNIVTTIVEYSWEEHKGRLRGDKGTLINKNSKDLEKVDNAWKISHRVELPKQVLDQSNRIKDKEKREKHKAIMLRHQEKNATRDMILRLSKISKYPHSDIEEALVFLKSRFTFDQYEVIKRGIKEGLSSKDIIIYADEELSPKKMNIIRDGLSRGLNRNYSRKLLSCGSTLKMFVLKTKALIQCLRVGGKRISQPNIISLVCSHF